MTKFVSTLNLLKKYFLYIIVNMKRGAESDKLPISKKQKIPQPVQDAWDRILTFRSLKTPTPEQVVALDHASTIVLRHHKIEEHCKTLGYSRQFHRYNDNYDYLTPKEELKMLSEHYWARSCQLDELKVLMNKKKKAVQKGCEHNWERDWEDRGHRSHWDCKKCGAYR